MTDRVPEKGFGFLGFGGFGILGLGSWGFRVLGFWGLGFRVWV